MKTSIHFGLLALIMLVLHQCDPLTAHRSLARLFITSPLQSRPKLFASVAAASSQTVWPGPTMQVVKWEFVLPNGFSLSAGQKRTEVTESSSRLV